MTSPELSFYMQYNTKIYVLRRIFDMLKNTEEKICSLYPSSVCYGGQNTENRWENRI